MAIIFAAWQHGDDPLGHSQSGVLTHELGHLWLAARYSWKEEQRRGMYGTPAADWLDETAAVLREDSVVTDRRRANLKDAYARGLLKPLDTLFTMQHPLGNDEMALGASNGIEVDTAAMLKAAQAALAAGKQQFSLMAVTSRPASDREMAALPFYTQCRGLIDFFLEQTGDPAVFGAIAKNELKGSTMAEWLRANGPRYRLPTTIAKLDKDWQRWLAQRVGPRQESTP